MQDHDWPGNIRELRNTIERAIALCLGREIQLEDLPEHFQHNKPAAATHPTFNSDPTSHVPSGAHSRPHQG